ncbi:MAG: hypothetical protein RI942_1729 [Pseudomonadota bacterium]|jgi:hypothetical protein
MSKRGTRRVNRNFCVGGAQPVSLSKFVVRARLL